ncbi:inositol monophosphatase [Paraburkholderia sp. UCT31]|uniref:inositol monophosphatase n=1 Tax=Paraburkholderia sp. UCT31 TaxID=2615209 RepID=UPI001655FDFD|nr:inositol monophosphatase [Paraburkholderia sp. UCT31]MBC8740412.1 inositol monophosphatase [Paraburkholderia sp. UCT31]
MPHPVLKELLSHSVTDPGADAEHLVAHVLSHRRFELIAEVDEPRRRFDATSVSELMNDRFRATDESSGRQILSSGYRLAGALVAQRTLRAWQAWVAAPERLAETNRDDYLWAAASPADMHQLSDWGEWVARKTLDAVRDRSVLSLFERDYEEGVDFLVLNWRATPEGMVPPGQRRTAPSPFWYGGAPARPAGGARVEIDALDAELSRYDRDKPLAFREKVGPYLLTMTSRDKHPQVGEESLTEVLAVFNDASTDELVAGLRLTLLQVPDVGSLADLAYVLDAHSSEMLSLALASGEALGADEAVVMFSQYRVAYVSLWEVRKQLRGKGVGAALLRAALVRLPSSKHQTALCIAPEPYQARSVCYDKLPCSLKRHLDAPAARLANYLYRIVSNPTFPAEQVFMVPMAKHSGGGPLDDAIRLATCTAAHFSFG